MKLTYMLNFEEALQEEHSKQHPQVLDDDLPDHFDNWLANLEQEDLIKLADKYGTFASQR